MRSCTQRDLSRGAPQSVRDPHLCRVQVVAQDESVLQVVLHPLLLTEDATSVSFPPKASASSSAGNSMMASPRRNEEGSATAAVCPCRCLQALAANRVLLANGKPVQARDGGWLGLGSPRPWQRWCPARAAVWGDPGVESGRLESPRPQPAKPGRRRPARGPRAP